MYTDITITIEYYEMSLKGYGYKVFYNDSKLVTVENQPLVTALETALDTLLPIQFRRQERAAITVDIRHIPHSEWLRTHICNRYATESVFANIRFL